MTIFDSVITLSVSFLASLVGSICGIGGGIIIKPVLDALGLFSVSTVSLLSGCTVMAMSGYSVLKNLADKKGEIDLRSGTFLGVGAALGGIAGKQLFEGVKALFANGETVGAVQAAALFVVTGATLVYTLKKDRFPTHRMESRLLCVVIGLSLGLVSSFLGIGGGPFNLAVLFYFFSMPTKTAAQNSLYIIFLSQFSSLAVTLIGGTVPVFSWGVLAGMVICGLLGAAAGRKLNRHLTGAMVNRLFIWLMVGIMGICVYNVFS